MNTFATVWRLLDHRQQRRLLILQLVCVVMAFSTVGGLAPVLPFFTALADPQAIFQQPMLKLVYASLHWTDPRRFVIALGGLFVAGMLLANAINLLGSLAIDRYAFEVGDRLHSDLFAEYLQRRYDFHLKTHSAILTSKVLHETGRVTGGILRHGLMLVTQSVTIVFILASIVWLNPLIGVLALVGLGASYAGVYAFARARLLRNGAIESREFAVRAETVSEAFAAIKELTLWQAQGEFVREFRRSCQAISRTIVNTFAISQSPRHILEGLSVCVLVGAALAASGRQGVMRPWLAELGFTALAVYRLLPALQQLFIAIVRIRSDRHALESIAADLRESRRRGECEDATTRATRVSWRGRPRCQVRLAGVSYFPTPERGAAIAELSLDIPAGRAVGFTGANGSGKTTLLDLVSGLLVPQVGQVQIDGEILGDANRSEWQSALAYLPQQVFLRDRSIAENVAFGVSADEIDYERVRAVVRLARLEECVNSLPRGYAERLGERGARLSGGERQRLGIARALYRDASLLLLDEPTSSLDVGAERDIIDMLFAERRGCTILLVSHRLAALRHCEVIYELAHGQILRSGSFDELSGAAARVQRSRVAR